MDGNLDTVREALNLLKGYTDEADAIADEALTALSAIDPKAIRRECWERVNEAYLTTDAWKDDLTLAVIRAAILSSESNKDSTCAICRRDDEEFCVACLHGNDKCRVNQFLPKQIPEPAQDDVKPAAKS